jgi:uncharacterized protein (DUF305 family)
MADREAIYRARIDSARTRFTPADVRFMTGMIAHHAQALTMANLVPSRSASESVRTLAARIHNAQADEIAGMQRWLRNRNMPAPELHELNGQVMVHAPSGLHDSMSHGQHGDHATMPGMITPEQLAQLAAARGVAFDRLFLTFMIAHHNGAVSMVNELFATDGAGQDIDVYRFASDVQVDQRTEVARMQLMLDAIAGTPRPF